MTSTACEAWSGTCFNPVSACDSDELPVVYKPMEPDTLISLLNDLEIKFHETML